MSEIVDSTPDYTAEQDNIVRNIYKHMAQLIPVVGRDFEIDISFKDNSNFPHIKMKGLTHMGNVWVRELSDYFKEYIDNGQD